jgi:hypothetical protein
VAVDAVFPQYTMEAYYVQHSPDHTWHYLDNQMEDEVVLFKTYDSDEMTANCAYLQGCDDIVLTTLEFVSIHLSKETKQYHKVPLVRALS